MASPPRRSRKPAHGDTALRRVVELTNHVRTAREQEDVPMWREGEHAGERNPNHKLTERQVAAIRRHAEKPHHCWGWKTALARKYHVSPGTIGDILHGRRW